MRDFLTELRCAMLYWPWTGKHTKACRAAIERRAQAFTECPNCGGPDGYPSGHAVGCPERS